MEVTVFWMIAVICATLVALSLIHNVMVRIRSQVSPEDVLARRYAAGEIDEREYLMRLSIVRDAKELTEQV